MSKQYSIFTSIYAALDGFCDNHPERKEEFVDWLSDANPNIWEGECSGDPAIYEDFLEFLSKVDYENLSISQIAKLYFAQLDDYYSATIRFVLSLNEQELDALMSKASGDA